MCALSSHHLSQLYINHSGHWTDVSVSLQPMSSMTGGTAFSLFTSSISLPIAEQWFLNNYLMRTSLVVQWFRIHLEIEGTRV